MKNKFLTTLLIAIFSFSPLTLAEPTKPTNTPIEVVNKRMAAYNQHNIEKFMALYAENIAVYTYPDIKLAGGKDHLASIFKPMFAEGKINVKIIKQITNGNYVINEEVVSYADKNEKYVSIYEVKEGLIVEVRFVRN